VLVYSMCREVIKAIKQNNDQVIQDVQRITKQSPVWKPQSAGDLCNRIFHTVFMGMENQSSPQTRRRAKELAECIGAYHIDVNIDGVFEAQKALISSATSFEPKFKVFGGSVTENLTLQNIQARSRMVTAYEFAQILPTVRGSGGSLLVLGSANVDECLRGYLTKGDCSFADINPIGGISKSDLKRFIAWAKVHFELPILEDFF